jgi:lysophospholipase L1-like esterase
VSEAFTTTADSSGQIVIQFTSVTENPKINGISIRPGTAPTQGPTAVTTPGPTPGGSTTISGNQVIVIGESFLAMSGEIRRNLETLARNAGILPSNESFIDKSVSGTRLSGGISPQIPQQYANGNTGKTVRWVIMDGGGNDCLQGSCSSPPTSSCTDLVNATNAARTLLSQMGNDGVIKVLYFFYPEPIGTNYAALKAKLDVLRPMIQNVVNSSTKPVCYWLDLRPIWNGHPEYTSDGIHPTSVGSQVTANAIWDVIQQNNFFSTN